LTKRLRSMIRGGVKAYHGSLTPEARKSVQDAFMTGLVRVVIATMAFGMGLDKPDIRTVVHFTIPKSLENFIQETGRGSRDGQPCNCVSLVNSRDYKSMRWLESGGGGSHNRLLAQRLVRMILQQGEKGPHKRFELSDEAVESLREDALDNAEDLDEVPEVRDGFRPFYVSFEERDMARELNCETDELHSMLVHLAHKAKGKLQLFSSFPTKLKLRFFLTDAEALAERDPLMRKVLPFAKKVAGVHTIESAQAVAQMGGKLGSLSNALWQARGDDYTVQKADYGYMIRVISPVDAELVHDFADAVNSINIKARANTLEKLDTVYLALTRAAEVGRSAASSAATEVSADLEDTEVGTRPPRNADEALTQLITRYFADTTGSPSLAVAETEHQRVQILRGALGGEYQSVAQAVEARALPSRETGKKSGASAVRPEDLETPEQREERRKKLREKVYIYTARLLISPEWPKAETGDLAGEAHAAAQLMAGIGSQVFPARKWKDHKCWAVFRDLGDFDLLNELVVCSVDKFRRLQQQKQTPAQREKRLAEMREKAGAGAADDEPADGGDTTGSTLSI